MKSKKPQFDMNLGGSTELPIEFNIMKFAAARAKEISDLSKSLENSGKHSLIFQRLPRHMRRRVMSHNVKRMPRNVRQAHEEQLRSVGAPTLRKRPSRKYRRRPANLLAEYNRRQRKYVWLETHIWHAKRFHMTEQWGYRLPFSPNDRSYRACYRATAKHCLLQDISFLCCIEIAGPLDDLLLGLSKHASPFCGLTFAAKSLLDGAREGELMFYESEQYPNKAIGTVSFIWKPMTAETKCRNIWIWVHPAFYEQVIDAFILTFKLDKVNSAVALTARKTQGNDCMDVNDETCSIPLKRQKMNRSDKRVEETKLANRNIPFERTPKYESECGKIVMTLLKDTLNRFRLTGPLSQAVLQEALHVVNVNKQEALQQSVGIERAIQKKPEENVSVSMDIDSIFSVLSNRSGKQASVFPDNRIRSDSNTTCEGIKQVSLGHVDTNIKAHHSYWQSLQGLLSPAELPPHMVLSLLVSDPRLQIPDKRSKALPDIAAQPQDIQVLAHPPPPLVSPIWSSSIRDEATRSKLSTAEINSLRSKLVVPGLLRTTQGPWNADSGALGDSVKVEVPLLLVQRPGSQDPARKRIGFGCGWDVILPAGWAMPLWLALIFRCAKPAGLREANAHMLESSCSVVLPPDTVAGHQEETKKSNALKDAYFRLPPNKRPNYIKLGVPCPFQCSWSCLLRDWASTFSDRTFAKSNIDHPSCSAELFSSFFVLRDRKLLRKLDDFLCITWKDIRRKKDFDRAYALKALESTISSVPDVNHCLLPVKVEAIHRGVTDNMSMICIPNQDDISSILSADFAADPVEELHEDKHRVDRQRTRKEHKKLLVGLRRQRVRIKRIQEKIVVLNDAENLDKERQKLKLKNKRSPTDKIVLNHKKRIEEMWLPSLDEIGSVVSGGSRKTAGFLIQGDFSFTEAKGCGTGYIALKSLLELVQLWLLKFSSLHINKTKSDSFIVLIRSTSSLKYRPAKLNVIFS